MNSHAIRERLDLTLPEMKTFLKVEHDNEDGLIEIMLGSAREQADLFLNNSFSHEDENGNEVLEDIPFTVKLAVMKMVSTWYEHRTDDKTSENVAGYSYSLGEIPWSSVKLLAPHRKLVGL